MSKSELQTWTDHMRHHERVTKNVQILEDKIKFTSQRWPETNSFSLYRKISFQILHPNFLFQREYFKTPYV
ncbi:MAG TPA: hypothetical protein VEW92_01070 [Nitrososphaeraceae archaeon]|nr:hypothetical protein [Nitrososphaeraceae archaeon]